MNSKKPTTKLTSITAKFRCTVRKLIKPNGAKIHISIDENEQVSILMKGKRELIIHALTLAFCEDTQFSRDSALASRLALLQLESHQAVVKLLKETLPATND